MHLAPQDKASPPRPPVQDPTLGAQVARMRVDVLNAVLRFEDLLESGAPLSAASGGIHIFAASRVQGGHRVDVLAEENATHAAMLGLHRNKHRVRTRHKVGHCLVAEQLQCARPATLHHDAAGVGGREVVVSHRHRRFVIHETVDDLHQLGIAPPPRLLGDPEEPPPPSEADCPCHARQGLPPRRHNRRRHANAGGPRLVVPVSGR